MATCSFCKENIEKGTGKMFVKKDARILYFCSRKCEKNLLKLKRKPRTTRWTKEYHQVKKGLKK
ncbi:50S ribosomal protein L24e [Candidatus Woesearchaeota archaeon]|nr:50S ribosomal protein L24e [Candidatus Woesearchaeota archaeon]